MGMSLKVLGSSSKGNCYVLDTGREALVLELGVPFREVKAAVGWDLGRVAGALVSHRHRDHAASVSEALSSGVRVLAPADVLDALGGAKSGLSATFSKAVAFKGYRLGGFKAVPFPLEHDAPCMGYLVEHPECGRLAFFTDTCSMDYVLPGIRVWMAEANYSEEILMRNIDSGRTPAGMRARLEGSHMELGRTKASLLAQDLSCADMVLLVHLSDSNSDAALFRSGVEAATGVPTAVLDAGMTFEIGRF